MSPSSCKILIAQVERPQFPQPFRPPSAKLIEKVAKRLSSALYLLTHAIEGLKRLRLTELENSPHARHPVGAVAIHQMSDDIKHRPGAFPFVLKGPLIRQIAQKRVESRRRAGKQRKGQVQVVCQLVSIQLAMPHVTMSRSRLASLFAPHGQDSGQPAVAQ